MSNKTKNTAINIFAILLGLFYAFTGAKKFYGWEAAKQSYLLFHPLWVYYFSATVEVVCGLGLLVPKARFGSTIGMLAMIAYVAVHPWSAGSLSSKFIVPAIVFTLLLVLLAWLSRPRRAAS